MVFFPHNFTMIIDRIKQIIENENISVRQFEERIGASQGVINKAIKLNGDIKGTLLEKTVEVFPHFNPSWLLTGRGEMKTTNIQSFKLRTDNNLDEQTIPVYNLEATAGLVNLFEHQGATEAVDHLRIPNLPKCDGAVFVTGDSMYPLLKSGDIVAYKEVKDLANDIFYGEMYIVSLDVSGDEFVSVKYVQRSELGEEYIKLVSHNQHHGPKDVHLKKVRAMALVKASVRINSMS